MKTKRQLHREIKAAKARLAAHPKGTPGHGETMAEFWALQKELGKVELADHDRKTNQKNQTIQKHESDT